MEQCLNPAAHSRFLGNCPEHVELLSHTTGASLEARWLKLVAAHTGHPHGIAACEAAELLAAHPRDIVNILDSCGNILDVQCMADSASATPGSASETSCKAATDASASFSSDESEGDDDEVNDVDDSC